MVGVCGVGKTTIAHIVYNSTTDQFDVSCFLAVIKEKSIKDGLVKLQKTLSSELFEENNINASDISKGISMLRMRLHREKVLLILDNVDESEQLKATAGGQDRFGSRS